MRDSARDIDVASDGHMVWWLSNGPGTFHFRTLVISVSRSYIVASSIRKPRQYTQAIAPQAHGDFEQ